MGRPGLCRSCGRRAVAWNPFNLAAQCMACGACPWPWRGSYAQIRIAEWLNRSRTRAWWIAPRITLCLGYYPLWRRFRLAIYENGGRQADEALDINWQAWRFTGSLTIWGLGRLSWLTRRLPAGPRGRGYTLGWLPS